MRRTVAVISSMLFVSSAIAEGVPSRVKAPKSPRTWAAVAISLSPDKDAFGYDYLKTSAAGAEMSATRYCEERFRKYRIQNGRCMARSSQDYVIGIYCVDGRRVGAGVGVGETAKEAATDALRQVSGFVVRRCVFQAMRHGSISKFDIDGARWAASVSCGDSTRGAREGSAIEALNAAFRSHNGSVSQCRVEGFSKT